jgi:hypothetical protein
MKENFIYSESEESFEDLLLAGEIRSDAVVFNADTGRIWTHNTYFPSEINKVDKVETLVINLASNQANPDPGIVGASVTVSYNAENYTLGYIEGESLVFSIPEGAEYTIQYSDIKDSEGNLLYKKPTDDEGQVYTAVADKLTSLTRLYTQTVITINRTSNQTLSLGNSTAEISCSSWSENRILSFTDDTISKVIKVLPDDEITITYSNIEGYNVESNTDSITGSNTITFTASGNSMTTTVTYKACLLSVTRSSNITMSESSTATVTYDSGSKEVTFNSNSTQSVIFPLGESYTIAFSSVANNDGALLYTTPENISGTGSSQSIQETGTYQGCSLTVQRTNNQGVAMDTTSAIVTYSSYSQTVNFTSSINEGIVVIPYNVDYTIAFNGTITNYRTPANITGTSNVDSVTEVGSYDSEKLIVNVNGLTSGFTITVNGKSQTATSGTYYIPYDTAYTISASLVKGYNKQISESSITASQQTRTVTVTYKTLINGIYICDKTGTLTAVESWNTANNSSAIGVAVISDKCAFIIDKVCNNNTYAWENGGVDLEISGIGTTIHSSAAKNDYEGKTNCPKIGSQLESVGANSPAVDICGRNNYSINGIRSYGYLGALGEWQTAYNNKSSINSALSKIGGTAMKKESTDRYWSSTQYNAGSAWFINWGNGNVGGTAKNYEEYVRIFYSIPYT